jgi:hypothetical protein
MSKLNDPINARRLAKTESKLEPIATASKVASKTPEFDQKTVNIIKERAFRRMIIEPKTDGFRVELERELDHDRAQGLSNLVKSHDYQSITVVQHDGNVARISQKLSVLMP